MSLSVDLLLAFSLFAFRHLRHARSEQHHVAGLGVNFGFVRSIPHILGISCGFFIMVMAVGFGLGTVFEAYPVLYTILRVGAAYLLYLAWKIVTSGPAGNDGGGGKPLSYQGAAAFQWVNPKACVMAVGAISTYTPLRGYFPNVVVISDGHSPDQRADHRNLGRFRQHAAQRVARSALAAGVQRQEMALLVASLYPILAEIILA